MSRMVRKPEVEEEPRPSRFEWPDDEGEGPPEAQFPVTQSFIDYTYEKLSYDSNVIVQRTSGPKPVVSETSIDKMPESEISMNRRAKRVIEPEIVQSHCDIDDDDYDDGHFESIHDFDDNIDEDGEDGEGHTSAASRSFNTVNSATPPKPILKSQSSPSPSKKVRFAFSAENNIAEKSNPETCTTPTQGQPLAEANHSSPTSNKKPDTSAVSVTRNHSKIINEVLKRHPHMVLNNKSIKLKIKPGLRPVASSAEKTLAEAYSSGKREKKVQYMVLKQDFTNSKKEVKTELVSGAENTTGPWFCIPCGDGKGPINFNTYYNYRRHFQEVHNEKVDARICEHCGVKSSRRNLHLYHLYTKHNIPPPRSINFPKCDHCEYIALSESLLIKHRSNHTGLINKEFICRVCNAAFKSNGALMGHMQTNLHRNMSEQMTKRDYECEFCGKIFNRNINLRAHIRTVHHEENRKSYEDEDRDGDPLQFSQASDQDVEVIDGPVYDSPSGNKTLYLSQGITILAESPNAPLMPSSESEAMNNVATGIATSINIADRNVANDVIVLNNSSELIMPGSTSYVLNQDGCYVQEYIVPEIMSDSGQVYTTALVSSAPTTGITYVNSDNISIIASGSDHTYADGMNISSQLTTVAPSNATTVITSQGNQSSQPILVQEPIIVTGDWVQSIATSQQQPLNQKVEIISASRPQADKPSVRHQRPQKAEAAKAVKAAKTLVSDWGDLEEENEDEADAEDSETKPSRPTIDLDVTNDMDM